MSAVDKSSPTSIKNGTQAWMNEASEASAYFAEYDCLEKSEDECKEAGAEEEKCRKDVRDLKDAALGQSQQHHKEYRKQYRYWRIRMND